jgi:hypothetical protein
VPGDCCVRNTNHPSSEGTFLISTPETQPIRPWIEAKHTLNCPLDTTTPQLHAVDLPYQADGGADWIQTTLAAYRANIANGQENIRRHGNFESLAGQEKDFTIRCNC